MATATIKGLPRGQISGLVEADAVEVERSADNLSFWADISQLRTAAAGEVFLIDAGTAALPGAAINGDPNTGVWGPAADVLGIAAGAVEVARFNAIASGVNYLDVTPGATGTPGVVTLAAAGSDTDIEIFLTPKGAGAVVVPAGTAANPSIRSTDIDSGIYFVGNSTLITSQNGTALTSNSIRTQGAAGFYLLNSVPSTTVPSLCPNKADTNTGIGWATDKVVLVGGALPVLIADGTVGTKGQVLLPQEDIPATPTLAWGDGTDGYINQAAGVLERCLAGIAMDHFANDGTSYTRDMYTVESNGAYWRRGEIRESITLNTGAAFTDSATDLLPANAIIVAVVARIDTTITTAVAWSLGDASEANRFTANNSTMTAGETDIGLLHQQGAIATDALGPVQVAAAKLRITLNANPGAGIVDVTTFYHQFVAPTS